MEIKTILKLIQESNGKLPTWQDDKKKLNVKMITYLIEQNIILITYESNELYYEFHTLKMKKAYENYFMKKMLE